jgi:SAM-dependent methyltransferase
MSTATTCQICAGPLRLLYPGSGLEARAEAFSPTNHQPGQYGDLYRCERCGTVAQPSLPRGEALLELYRHMRDEHYLDEEEGRRATARRLLDEIAKHAPGGRLLDVGCGHGLLLDEARARGYSVEGLELSEQAFAHAHDALSLTVHARTLGDLVQDPDAARYAVIVLADVLEHLDDPPRAIANCVKLLEPDGVLCVVTPDPGSRTARLAGAGWWGYLPAHTYLLPRLTLRELLERSGVAIAADLPFVRTFSLRYWMAGLAERGGAVGRTVSLLRAAAPKRMRVSLSLGDERVVVARYAALGVGGTGSVETPAAVGSSVSG